MKNIRKHLKDGEFSRVYLLYGEEKFLVRTYKNQLKNAICGDDNMNFSHYEGKELDINDVRDTSLTLPFWADRRLILIEDCGLFKTSSESMADIVKNAPESTYFIFTDSEVDKRNKLFKTVSECGYVAEMKSQTDEDLSNWALRIFAEAGKKITRDNMNLFLRIAGPQMDNLYNEAEKLVSYCMKKDTITDTDIVELCSVRTVDRVFDMIQEMANRNTDAVMKLYADLLALKEPPMKLLALIGRHFSQLLAVRKLMEQGQSAQAIASRLGIRPYFIGKYVSQAKGYSYERLKEAVNDCIEAETSIKTGLREDKYAVELLIIKYSM